MSSILHSIRNSIPSFIQMEYPKFVDFLMTYYSMMEKQGHLKSLLDFEDNIKGRKDDPIYIQKFLSELGFDVGVGLNTTPELQYKLINDFMSMRGSEPSLKLLFRLLFNEDVNIEYPRDGLLYTSAANYVHNNFLITSSPDVNLSDISFAGVVGLSSNATASTENIDVIVTQTGRYLIIECSNASDDFIIDEVIRILVNNQQIDVLNKGVIQVDVEVSGNGYSKGDVVTISGCDQTGIGYVSAITNGSIESIDVVYPGIGYKKGELIKAYNGFTGTITDVGPNGEILSVGIKHGGYKYKEYPQLNILSSGRDAVLQPYGSKVGGIKTISFDNPYAICSNSLISVNSSIGYGFEGRTLLSPSTTTSKWTDKKGMLGVNGILIDSDVYHEFSYRIVSSVPSEKYIDLIDEFTHPYGFVRVPVLSIERDANINERVDTSDIEVYNEYTVVTNVDILNDQDLFINEVRKLDISIETEVVIDRIV